MKQVKIVKIHVKMWRVIFPRFFTKKKCRSLQKQAATLLSKTVYRYGGTQSFSHAFQASSSSS